MSNKGAALMASLIVSAPHLERLDLSDNAIGDKGAAALAKACRHTLKIEDLYLANNKIRDFGAYHIARRENSHFEAEKDSQKVFEA